MKMYGDESALLLAQAHEHGVELSDHQLDLFLLYLDELEEWNRKMNLTGLSKRAEMITELFVDSLIPAPFLPRKGWILDVGSGAGFPGIPMKIYNDQLNVHILEPHSKKVSFLKQVIRLLGLKDIEVIKGRVENCGSHFNPSGYCVVTARALAGLDQIISWCSPLLSSDGILISFLGSSAEDDLKRNRQAMEDHSLFINRIIPYSLPGKSSQRTTVFFRKRLTP